MRQTGSCFSRTVLCSHVVSNSFSGCDAYFITIREWCVVMRSVASVRVCLYLYIFNFIYHCRDNRKNSKQTRKCGTINDVLLLKAARRDSIANFKCFGASDSRDLISIVIFTSPPYFARISPIYFLPFANVWLGSVSVCNAWEAQCIIYERWVRTLDSILTRL